MGGACTGNVSYACLCGRSQQFCLIFAFPVCWDTTCRKVHHLPLYSSGILKSRCITLRFAKMWCRIFCFTTEHLQGHCFHSDVRTTQARCHEVNCRCLGEDDMLRQHSAPVLLGAPQQASVHAFFCAFTTTMYFAVKGCSKGKDKSGRQWYLFLAGTILV